MQATDRHNRGWEADVTMHAQLIDRTAHGTPIARKGVYTHAYPPGNYTRSAQASQRKPQLHLKILGFIFAESPPPGIVPIGRGERWSGHHDNRSWD
eukprot:6550552-Alexandrium_andersonii.AAC.1